MLLIIVNKFKRLLRTFFIVFNWPLFFFKCFHFYCSSFFFLFFCCYHLYFYGLVLKFLSRFIVYFSFRLYKGFGNNIGQSSFKGIVFFFVFFNPLCHFWLKVGHFGFLARPIMNHFHWIIVHLLMVLLEPVCQFYSFLLNPWIFLVCCKQCLQSAFNFNQI